MRVIEEGERWLDFSGKRIFFCGSLEKGPDRKVNIFEKQ